MCKFMQSDCPFFVRFFFCSQRKISYKIEQRFLVNLTFTSHESIKFDLFYTNGTTITNLTTNPKRIKHNDSFETYDVHITKLTIQIFGTCSTPTPKVKSNQNRYNNLRNY